MSLHSQPDSETDSETGPHLLTPRLLLRPFTAGDGDDLVRLHGDAEVMRYVGNGRPDPPALVREHILPRFRDRQGGSPAFWAASERSAEGASGFVGWFSFRPLEEGRWDAVELGFRLHRGAWGRGLATEGARELLRWGFTVRGVERVVATTYQDNVGSRRVLEKLGFRLVRRFRMTVEDLDRDRPGAVSTFSADDLWDGDDLELALEGKDWQRDSAPPASGGEWAS